VARCASARHAGAESDEQAARDEPKGGSGIEAHEPLEGFAEVDARGRRGRSGRVRERLRECAAEDEAGQEERAAIDRQSARAARGARPVADFPWRRGRLRDRRVGFDRRRAEAREGRGEQPRVEVARRERELGLPIPFVGAMAQQSREAAREPERIACPEQMQDGHGREPRTTQPERPVGCPFHA